MALSVLRRAWFAIALLLVMLPWQPALGASALVAAGKDVYTSATVSNPLSLSSNPGACSSCHWNGNPPQLASAQVLNLAKVSNHPLAANRPQAIRNAFGTNGVMTVYLGTNPVSAPSAAQRDAYFKLSLWIGQFTAPAFFSAPTMRVASGRAGTLDVFPLLVNDGTGGVGADTVNSGVITSNSLGAASSASSGAGTVSADQAAGAVLGVSTLAYNLSYQSAAEFDGPDTFYVKVTNPTGTVIQPVTVTVLGINSASSVRGVKGTTYTAGAGAFYKVTSSDSGATTFTATGLPTGLTINPATGDIIGTPTVTGDYTVTVGATTTTATESANGTVSKTVTMSIDGISSASSATYAQGTAITTYQITSFPPAQATFYTLTPAIPAGLSFSTSTGQLTGTPTVSGVYNLTVGARTNAPVSNVSQALTITVTSAGLPVVSSNLPVSPSNAGNVNDSAAYTAAAYAVTLSNPSLTNMAFSATGLPPGMSINTSTGAITGTPTVSGDYPLVLGGRNVTGFALSNLSRTIRVNPVAAPAVTAPTLPATLTVGTPIGNIPIQVTNLPITAGSYAATGQLPPGLSVAANTGIISGTPNQSGGPFTFQLQAANPFGTGTSAAITYNVIPNAVPVVTSTPTLTAQTYRVGTPITAIQIDATNPAIQSGSYAGVNLPPGLAVDPNTGQLTGNPTQSGTFPNVQLQARNAVGLGSSTPVTITVLPNAVPVISNGSNTNPVVVDQNANLPTYQINATNPPFTGFAVVGGALPTGLSLNTSTGQITGIPTVSGVNQSVSLQASNDVGNSVPFVLNFTVNPTQVPTVTAPLPVSPTAIGRVGTAITPVQISATNTPITGYGGQATGGGALPAGLSVDLNGRLVGIPSVSGDFPIQLSATNGFGTGSTASTLIRIDPDVVPVVTTSPAVLDTGLPVNSRKVGNAIGSIQVVASNPPINAGSYAATGLPSGVTINPTTGAVSGTPILSGVYTVQFSAANIRGTGQSASATLTIEPNAIPAVTTTLAPGQVVYQVGTPITNFSITATNLPIATYGAVGLPPGLTVHPSTGVVSGTPSTSGNYSVQFTATNSVGPGTSASVAVLVNPNQVPVLSAAANPPAGVLQNQAYSASPLQTTQPPILSYAVAPGSALPPGLSLNTATGVISGTPTTSGNTLSTAFTARNFAGDSAPFTLNWSIVPSQAPVVTVSIPAVVGKVGTAITPIQINATNPAISGYGANNLPAGLSVNGSGQIVGTPTANGIFTNVTFTATNAQGLGTSAPQTLRINPNALPVINSAATETTATANNAFSPGYQITATNGPIDSYAVAAPSSLPPGLSLNTSTGAITGTPTASGSFSTSLRATNSEGQGPAFTLSFTIAPSAVPGISSPTFASMGAGVAITPIQVVATNPIILDYAAINLPPGLSINTATGIISGTPTTPGSYSATLSARNSVGSGNRVVPFTIGVPAPSACALSVPLNTPTSLNLATCLFSGFTPSGATIVGTPAHGTAVVSGTTVLYTPVNNYFGADSFTYVATGAGGTAPQGVVNVTVTGRPDPLQDKAVTAVIAAQAETSARFARAQVSNFQRRMEALHRGAGAGPASGASLQSGGSAPASSNLAAVVGSGFAAGAVGAGSGNGSGVAGVGVPAPMAGGLFSDSPTNVPAAAPSQASGVMAPRLGVVDPVSRSTLAAANYAANSGANVAMPRIFGRDVTTETGMGAVVSAGQGPNAVRESEALNAIVTGTGLRSLPFSDSVISMIRSRSVDLAGLGSGLGLNTTPDATGKTSYWVEGVASFGTRDASGGFSGSEFSSSGISVGVDHRINKDLAVGMGVGYARDKATIGTDGSVNRSKGYSLAAYGSYQLTDTTYLDALLGFGSLDFDTKRFVQPMNDFAYGQRNGTQVFGSVTGGYEWRQRDLLVSPYARLDFSTDRLASSTETGAGAFALTYFNQTNSSVQGSLGVRAESAHATSFGYAVPRVRAEVRHEFKGSGEAFVGYADQPGGPRYALAALGGSRNTMVLGIGGEFLMRDGLTLSMEYQLSHSFSNDSSYALRLRLSKDFDARGLPKLRLAPQEADDEPINLQFDAGYTTDSNVTRAKTGPDRLNDDAYSVNVSKTWIHDIGETSRVLVTGSAGGEKFHRFNGLSKAAIGVEAEYQYRASSEFDEPTFGAVAKFNAEDFQSSLRDGYRLSLGLSLRQALTDRIGAFGAVSRNFRSARSAVFDNNESAVRGNLDYALSSNQTLYLGGELRRGDIASTGRATLENVTIAKVFVQDDVFPGGNMFSYKVEGNTVLTTLGYNLSFGPKDSLDLSWRHVRSTPGLRPSFVTSPKSYKANQLSAVYLLRF